MTCAGLGSEKLSCPRGPRRFVAGCGTGAESVGAPGRLLQLRPAAAGIETRQSPTGRQAWPSGGNPVRWPVPRLAPDVRGHVPLGVSEHARRGATGGDQWTRVFPSKSCGMRGDTINDVAPTTLLAGLTHAVGLAQHQPGHGEAAGSPSGAALARPSAQEDLGASPRGLSPGCWFPGQAPHENRGVTTVYTQPQESDRTSVVSTRSPERSGETVGPHP